MPKGVKKSSNKTSKVNTQEQIENVLKKRKAILLINSLRIGEVNLRGRLIKKLVAKSNSQQRLEN